MRALQSQLRPPPAKLSARHICSVGVETCCSWVVEQPRFAREHPSIDRRTLKGVVRYWRRGVRGKVQLPLCDGVTFSMPRLEFGNGFHFCRTPSGSGTRQTKTHGVCPWRFRLGTRRFTPVGLGRCNRSAFPRPIFNRKIRLQQTSRIARGPGSPTFCQSMDRSHFDLVFFRSPG